MNVVEMRMLIWMCGKARKNKVRNEDIHCHVVIASIKDKLRENCLWWLGLEDQGMYLLKGRRRLTYTK